MEREGTHSYQLHSEDTRRRSVAAHLPGVPRRIQKESERAPTVGPFIQCDHCESPPSNPKQSEYVFPEKGLGVRFTDQQVFRHLLPFFRCRRLRVHFMDQQVFRHL